MSRFPSINQAVILGKITKVEYRPGTIFCWNFDVTVPSPDRSAAVLLCGAPENILGEMIENVDIGQDWVLIEGKVRHRGFIQVRELSIINEPKQYHLPTHHVTLLGEIKSIRKNTGQIYSWQFDIDVYKEYGINGEVEASLTCGIGESSGNEQFIQSADAGHWVSLRGKVRNAGFIQVISMCVFHKI